MNIFVAKLSSETTPENLKELFSQFGSVATTKVIMDRETGRSKCYGFVEMLDDSDGLAAIENLNETEFMGSTILAKKSEPKAQDRSSDRRGGGGGFQGNRGFGRRDNNRDGGGGFNRDNRGGGFNRDRSDDRGNRRDRNDRY